MPKHSLYTIKSVAGKEGVFTASKMSIDLEPLEIYTLEERGHSVFCTCPAHKPWCRHKEMLRLFQAEDRVDSGYLYNFDKKEWSAPIVP